MIGLVGKYTELHDTYLSVVKALLHASLHCNRKLTVKWIDSSALDTAKQHKVKGFDKHHELPSLALSPASIPLLDRSASTVLGAVVLPERRLSSNTNILPFLKRGASYHIQQGAHSSCSGRVTYKGLWRLLHATETSFGALPR